MDQAVLRVENLETHFQTRRGVVRAVNGVSFELGRGQTLGIVGESGSGKSVTLQSILRMVPGPGGRIVRGRIELNGRDLISLSEKQMAAVRGREVSMIMQDPMTSLDPLFMIGDQIAEALPPSQPRRTARERVFELLRSVRDPRPRAASERLPASDERGDAAAGGCGDLAGQRAHRALGGRADYGTGRPRSRCSSSTC